MMSDFTCVNCGAGEPMERPPFPSPYGRELQSKVCAGCWQNWKGTEVMIVNEYRLNLLEREDRKRLREQMTRFLNLDGSRTAGEAVDLRPEEFVPEKG
jgi:Fe-S cluster biosynthesis and repair protein YggX